MAYQKQTWRDFPNTSTPISAQRLGHLETQYDEAVAYTNTGLGTKASLGPDGKVPSAQLPTSTSASAGTIPVRSTGGVIPGVSNPSSPFDAANKSYVDFVAQGGRFNVKDYGAQGNGSSDDTPAIQAALDAASSAGGGTVVIPPGVYLMSSYAVLRSDVSIVGEGATIIKNASSSSYACFASLSNGSTGYGSGANRVRVSGLVFRGSFTSGAERVLCGFALHHASNILVENCEFIECAGRGHQFDLNGCDGVWIRSCTFRGFLTGFGSNRDESVQIDRSAESSVSVADAPGSYDGLGTKNVWVDSCYFTSLRLGSVTHPAPIAVGSHAVDTGKEYENINVLNNVIDSQVPNTSTQIPGALHFVGVRGLNIVGNQIENPLGVTAVAIWVGPYTHPTLGLSVCRDVSIRGNSISGFSSSTQESNILDVSGDPSSRVVGVKICDNTLDATQDRSSPRGILVSNAQQVSVSGNVTRGQRGSVSTVNCSLAVVSGNSAHSSTSNAFAISGSQNVLLSGNSAQSCDYQAFDTDASEQVSITGNVSTFQTLGSHGIRVSNTPRTSITGNVLHTSTVRTNGIIATGTSTCVAIGNAIEGFTNKTVAQSGGSLVTVGNL